MVNIFSWDSFSYCRANQPSSYGRATNYCCGRQKSSRAMMMVTMWVAMSCSVAISWAIPISSVVAISVVIWLVITRALQTSILIWIYVRRCNLIGKCIRQNPISTYSVYTSAQNAQYMLLKWHYRLWWESLPCWNNVASSLFFDLHIMFYLRWFCYIVFVLIKHNSNRFEWNCRNVIMTYWKCH